MGITEIVKGMPMKSVYRLMIVFAMLLISSAAGAKGINPALLEGQITYSHEGDVYVMNADGSNVTRLTDNPAQDFDSVWSPDGKQIAFRSHRDGDEEVYVMNADGSDQRNLSDSPGGDYSPAWSPDGTQIAFMSDRNNSSGNSLFVMNADGSDPVQITDIPGINEYPSWSPDGKQLAFHCTFGKRLPGGEGDFEICIVNADGTELTQLTDTEGTNKFPAWSPDGLYIAFESTRDGWPTLPDYVPLGYDEQNYGDKEIYLMLVDGSQAVNVTQNPREDDSFAAWSKDGMLVFTRYGCLMVMHPFLYDPVSITQSPNCAGDDSGHFPDWFQPET
jgi:Tol biopolymer transport system component